MTIRLQDAIDGVASPDWVEQTVGASGPLATGHTIAISMDDRAAIRRSVVDQVLATKLLDAHLRNRIQLMERDPTDLSGVSAADAALLIRAMATAGHADGGLEQVERKRLIGYARASLLDDDVRRDVLAEIETPASLESLVRLVETPKIAERFYAVSTAVIRRDLPISRAYLDYLALRLNLSKDVVLRINRVIDLSSK